jgi:hypothetical protein
MFVTTTAALVANWLAHLVQPDIEGELIYMSVVIRLDDFESKRIDAPDITHERG